MQPLGRFQITVRSPEGTRTEVFERSEFVIGRSASADLVISNSEVSRKHLLVKWEENQVRIMDLGSKNGTFVDGKSIPGHTGVAVSSGQKIRFGQAPDEVQIRWDAQSQPLREEEAPPPLYNVPTQKFDMPDTLKDPSPIETPWAGSQPQVQPQAQVAPQAQAHSRAEVSQLEIRRSKLEADIRELENEAGKRLAERKEIARQHADAKLRVQQLEEEFNRLRSAKDSLHSELNKEIGELDARSQQLASELETATKQQSDKFHKSLKEQVEKAKKQSSLLISEAEMKAKSIKDKAQAEAANARKTAELDIAELKLKQMQEVKEEQEREESMWRERRENAAKQFLADLHMRIEEGVQGMELPDAAKLQLISLVEEGLFHYFSPQKIAAVREEMTATGINYKPSANGKAADQPDADEPPALPQLLRQPVPLMIVSAMAALIVGLAIGRSLSTPPVTRQVASVQTDAETREWTELASTGETNSWQKWSGEYLRKTVKVDGGSLRKYQESELQFLAELQRADSKRAQGLTGDFARDSEKLLGAKAWRQVLSLRGQFLKRNR